MGDAYQTLTGTITGDTLTITAAPNDTSNDLGDGGPFTAVNGFQLQVQAATVPEPSTATVSALMMGMALLYFRRQISTVYSGFLSRPL